MNQPQYGQRASYGENDFCYRHKDRPSFVLCQRCGNTVCPDCQISQPVGLICPACAKELAVPATTKMQRGMRAAARRAHTSETPVVTYTIMALCALVWLGQMFNQQVSAALWYAPIYSTVVSFEPWRMFTAMFTHSTASFFHLLFNMYALFAFGRQLELMLGRVFYAALYVLSGLGGSLLVMWWAALDMQTFVVPTVGASGALFGVLAATLVVYRHLQINVTSLAVLIAINLLLGFLPGVNISWQAHLGGMIFGALTMLLLLKFTHPQHQGKRMLALGMVLLMIIAATASFYFYTAELFVR